MRVERLIIFTIPGQPVAKGRPRFARRGAGMAAYTPQKTQSYENLVKLVAASAMQGREPSAAPMSLYIVLSMQIPASWSAKRRAMAAGGQIRATKKPDADNVLKSVKDGCNGIVWRDDAQVVIIMLQKKYAEIPSVIVNIKELLGESA